MLATMSRNEIDISEVGVSQMISFANGMLGFEELTRFVLVGDERTYPCLCLQSLDDPWVGFTVVDPFLLFSDYSFTLSEADRMALKLEDGEPFDTLVVVVVPEDPMEMTANLLAPVIINRRAGLGRQVILQGHSYSVRHPVIRPQSRE